MGRKTGGFAQLYDYINELRISIEQVKNLVKVGLPVRMAGALWRKCSSDKTSVAFRNSRRFDTPDGWKDLPRGLRNQVLDLYHGAGKDLGKAMVSNFLVLRDKEHVVVPKFLKNFRDLSPRKNGNAMYHEVISFSGLDAGNLTHHIIADLTKKYLSLRAPGCLAYAKAHYHGDNPHVHLMISANPKGSSKRHYLLRHEFAKIKQELQAYQQEKYPQLIHSIVDHGQVQKRQEWEQEQALAQSVVQQGQEQDELGQVPALKKNLTHRPESRKESELHRRARHQKGVDLVKDRVTKTVIATLSQTETSEAFRSRLLQNSLHLYERGKHHGVVDLTTGRKFRLNTLGLEQVYEKTVMQWQVLKEYSQKLEQQRLHRDLDLGLSPDDPKHEQGHDPPEGSLGQQHRQEQRRHDLNSGLDLE